MSYICCSAMGNNCQFCQIRQPVKVLLLFLDLELTGDIHICIQKHVGPTWYLSSSEELDTQASFLTEPKDGHECAHGHTHPLSMYLAEWYPLLHSRCHCHRQDPLRHHHYSLHCFHRLRRQHPVIQTKNELLLIIAPSSRHFEMMICTNCHFAKRK